MLWPILATAVLIIVVWGGSQMFGPLCAKYHLTDSAVEFVLFGTFRVWRAPFGDIADIERISFGRMFITPALGLITRPFGAYVLLRRHRGFFRAVLMTPPMIPIVLCAQSANGSITRCLAI